MTDLMWPGDHRAGDLLGDAAILDAMVAVEAAWLASTVDAGIAPAGAAVALDVFRSLVGPMDVEPLAQAAESGGNPVLPLISMLRDRLEVLSPGAARWLHRGLTSQDVVDSALAMAARDAVAAVAGQLREQVQLLADLVERHRHTPAVARTLTQHAVPTTFGLKAARWLTAVLDAYDDAAGLVFHAQLGGAAGTMAAAVELAAGLPDPVRAVLGATTDAAARLRLTPSNPWHTVRSGVTRMGDAAVRCTDAWGRIANDVLVLTRPEIGELAASSSGGSSTMPHKTNPTLAVLVRRAALTAPPLAATLHAAAAGSIDERADGAWHAEWATLRTLLRRTVVAGFQTTELLAGLRVDASRMTATLDAAPGVRAEQRSMAELTGRPPATQYLGAADVYLQAALTRAARAAAERAP